MGQSGLPGDIDIRTTLTDSSQIGQRREMNTSLSGERHALAPTTTNRSHTVYFQLLFLFSDPCNLPPATGPCRGSFPMYYYDSKTKQCERFIYGGCGGNANRFYTIEECDRTCGKLTIQLPLELIHKQTCLNEGGCLQA